MGKQVIEPYPERIESPPAAVERPPAAVADREGRQPQGEIAVPATSGQLPGTVQPPAEELLPLLTRVDDRIAAYEEKLRVWEGLRAEAEKLARSPELDAKMGNCREQLQGIIGSYNQLHDQLIGLSPSQSPEAETLERFQDASEKDIAFLESECQMLIAGGQQAGSLLAGASARNMEEGEKEIAAALAAGDYARVISLYEHLSAGDGQKPSLASMDGYGQALLHSGREQEAAQVFAALLQLLQQQNQVGREFQLMQLLADIQFGLEDYSNAFTGYVQIINRYASLGENIEWARKQQTVISTRNQQGDEVKGFAALMLASLGFNQSRDGFKVVLLAEQFLARFPESIVTPTVNRILFEARDRAENWYAGNLQQIDRLKDEKKYAEALQLIQGMPMEELPPEKKAQLQGMLEEMTTVQVQETEMQHAAEEAALQERWRKGQEHLQLKEYDQAIAVFSGMLNTAYADRAQSEITAAANLAAQEDRRKAAELFVQAGSAKDQAARVALLLQSRQLLQNILTKYPQSDLGEKVRKNLDRIETDLRGIDPALLTMSTPPPAGNNGAPPPPAIQNSSPVNGGEAPAPSGTGIPPGAGTGE